MYVVLSHSEDLSVSSSQNTVLHTYNGESLLFPFNKIKSSKTIDRLDTISLLTQNNVFYCHSTPVQWVYKLHFLIFCEGYEVKGSQ